MKSEVSKSKLLMWHDTLLSEAKTIAYRLVDETTITDDFLEDLLSSLERLGKRVRAETRGVSQ